MSSDWESGEDGSSVNSVDTDNETSDIEDIEQLFTNNLQPYMFEPESSVDQNTEEDNSQDQDSQVEREIDFAVRVNNKDWCLCENCEVEVREIDCLCCSEIEAISEDKFEGVLNLFLTRCQNIYILSL